MKCAISEPRVRTFNSTAFDNPAGLRLRLFLLAQWSKPAARSGEDALVLRACHPDPSMERLIASSRVPGPAVDDEINPTQPIAYKPLILCCASWGMNPRRHVDNADQGTLEAAAARFIEFLCQ